jgi:hypothetical protein
MFDCFAVRMIITVERGAGTVLLRSLLVGLAAIGGFAVLTVAFLWTITLQTITPISENGGSYINSAWIDIGPAVLIVALLVFACAFAWDSRRAASRGKFSRDK